MGDKTWVQFSLGMMMFLLCGWSKFIRFQCRDQHCIGCLCGGRDWLAFSVCIEKSSVFVSGHRSRLETRVRIERCFFCSDGVDTDLVSVCGIEIDLVLVWGWELFCFMWGDRIDLFSCAALKWLVFSVGIDWLGVCMRTGNHLIIVWASKLTWFLCGWSKLAWFQCGE